MLELEPKKEKDREHKVRWSYSDNNNQILFDNTEINILCNIVSSRTYTHTHTLLSAFPYNGMKLEEQSNISYWVWKVLD